MTFCTVNSATHCAVITGEQVPGQSEENKELQLGGDEQPFQLQLSGLTSNTGKELHTQERLCTLYEMACGTNAGTGLEAGKLEGLDALV